MWESDARNTEINVTGWGKMMAIQKRERNVNLDIIRITACMLVVLSHISSNWLDVMPTSSFIWKAAHMYNTLGHTGTILFLFLSGYLLLSEDYDFKPRNFYTGKFLRLFVAYYSWIIIYHVIGFVQRGNWGTDYMKDVVINVIKGEASYHFWYVPMLLGIYLILPMLRAICRAGKNLVVYFTVLFGVTGVLFPTILFLDFPHKYLWESLMTRIPFTLVNHHVGYFVMGYLLYLLLKEKEFSHWMACSVVPVIIGMTGSLAGDMIVSAQQEVNSLSFNNLFSAPLCMCAVGIFLFFIKLPVKTGGKMTGIVTGVSRLTFGIYMIHPLAMKLVERVLQVEGSYGVIGIPVVTLFTFGISLAMVYLLSLVPTVRKWILFA